MKKLTFNLLHLKTYHFFCQMLFFLLDSIIHALLEEHFLSFGDIGML